MNKGEDDIAKVAKQLGMNLNTAKTVLRQYKKDGKTSKMPKFLASMPRKRRRNYLGQFMDDDPPPTYKIPKMPLSLTLNNITSNIRDGEKEEANIEINQEIENPEIGHSSDELIHKKDIFNFEICRRNIENIIWSQSYAYTPPKYYYQILQPIASPLINRRLMPT